MSPKRLGNALWTDIDSEDRAAGRMVVWVDAAAEVSTATMRSLPQNDPSTPVDRAPSTSLLLLVRKSAPWYACADTDTSR